LSSVRTQAEKITEQETGDEHVEVTGSKWHADGETAEREAS